MDDLLCTENLTNYYENETQQQAPQTQPIQTTATSSSSFLGTRTSTNQEASSPYSDASLSSSGSLSCSSGYVSNASSSSNYGSSAALHFDFSKCSYSHSRYITCSGCSNQRQQQQKIIVTTTTATSVTPQRVERSNSVDGGGGAGINIKNGLVMVNSVEHYRNFDHNRPKTTQSTQTHNNNNNHSQSFQMNNAYINKQLNNNLNNVNTATEDPTFLTDRCLENALKTEEKRPHTICTYFKTVQKDITPPMRKIVAEWMMEVCAEEKCQEEVVLLALNYMDRFLSTKPVRKTHLQILAAACLLLASKLREPSCRALSAELLVFYTDNSIFKNDLIKWELFVLSRLGWDLSSVTPLDFLELLLIRLPIRSTKYPDLNVDTVRQHAQAFISLAAKEHHFSIYSASTIAASSIAAALSGLNWHLRSGKNLRYLLNLLTDLTSVEQDFLHECMIKMEAIFEEHSRNLQPFADSEETHQQQQHLDEDSTQQYNQHEQYQLQQHHQLHNQQQSPQQQLPQQQHTTAAPPQNLHHHSHHIHHGTIMHSTQPPEHFGLHGNSVAAVAVAAAGNVLLPDLTQTCKMQANTQKDVQDIKF